MNDRACSEGKKQNNCRKLFQRERPVRKFSADEELFGNFKERAGIGDLLTDLLTKFEHQNQLLESEGVADPQVP